MLLMLFVFSIESSHEVTTIKGSSGQEDAYYDWKYDASGDVWFLSVSKYGIIIVDGIRNVEEINLFKKELSKDFVVIAIDAPDELRKKRALSRGRKDDSKDIKNVEERDKREMRWGIGDVIASADIVIPNEGSIEEFRKQVGEVLQKL